MVFDREDFWHDALARDKLMAENLIKTHDSKEVKTMAHLKGMLSKENPLIPNFIHLCQYNWIPVSNHNGMFMLRHKAAFISNHCPTVL